MSNDFWPIPRIWNGGDCFILGGGPSLREVAMGKLYGKRVIAVNNAYLRCPWAAAVYFQDCAWYREPIGEGSTVTHQEALREFKGYKITACRRNEEEDGSVKVVDRASRQGFAIEPHRISGNNSGYGAICLAIKFGASRLLLLGFDMQMRGKDHNWHGRHRREIGPTVYESQFLPTFKTLGPALKKLEIDVEIINCTPNSMLNCFPHGQLEDYL